MEPRIQYAKTDDGVNIAFWTLGEGKPLVDPFGLPFGHAQLEWQNLELRRWYEGLARNRRLIRYDNRGTGLSEGATPDLSLEARLLDVQAVVDRLRLDTFALLGMGDAGPETIAYAARWPNRVSRLILWCAYARYSDNLSSSQLRGLGGLLNRNWELYTETLAHAWFGWTEGDAARRWAAFMRKTTTPDAVRVGLAQVRDIDVETLLPQVRSPTLVLQRREHPVLDVKIATELASRIPDSRLVILEGSSPMPVVGDLDAVLEAIDEFLDEDEGTPALALVKEDVHTILFTDVEESTALTDRLGDAKARDVLRTHESIVRDALRAHAGSEVKTMGDGFMASFSSATKALECAIAMQRSFAEHNETAEEPIRVRVGLNAGEPIAEEEDLFGTAVIVAARIAAKAEGAEIIASDVVRQLVAGKGFLFADRGDTALRGFEDPVRLFEVRWRAEG